MEWFNCQVFDWFGITLTQASKYNEKNPEI